RKGGPLHQEAVDELRGQVLGVGGAAAVAEEEQFAAGPKNLSQPPGRGHHRFALFRGKSLLEAAGLRHGLLKSGQQGHHGSLRRLAGRAAVIAINKKNKKNKKNGKAGEGRPTSVRIQKYLKNI